MRDRIAQNPGRVLVTPESGEPFYATLTRADNPTQEGTPLSKGNLLSDATAALFGLDDDGTVNDALRLIGTRNNNIGNEWVWKKYKSEQVYDSTKKSNYGLFSGNVSSYSYSYAPSIQINGSSIELVNPVSQRISVATAENWNVFRRNYLDLGNNKGIIYIPTDATFTSTNSDSNYNVSVDTCYLVESPYMKVTFYGYVNSQDENKYTDGETAIVPMTESEADSTDFTLSSQRQFSKTISVSNGAAELVGAVTSTLQNYSEEELRGMYFLTGTTLRYIPENATFTTQGDALLISPHYIVTGATEQKLTDDEGFYYEKVGQIGNVSKIAIISYVGTGTYGASNPTKITADFEIVGMIAVNAIKNGKYLVFADNLTTSYVSAAGPTADTSYQTYGKISEDKKTISWYSLTSQSSNATNAQLNTAGSYYAFIVFG